jgi:hypothetical protein
MGTASVLQQGRTMNALDDISTIKVKVARAQLGSAMDLFIRDKDAYSVQALACEGCEVIDGVAKLNNINRFALHIMRNYPDVDESEIKRRQNLYWNAIKHEINPKGLTRESGSVSSFLSV